MIRSLFLKSFKSFQDIQIPFGNLTLLSGVNGSGKSTVLQSLAALKQSYEKDCLTRSGGLLLNGDYVELGVGRDVLCEYSDESQIVIAITDEFGVSRFSFRYEEGDDLLRAVDDGVTASYFPLWLSRGFQFLKADRIVPSVVYPKSYHEGVSRRFLGVRGQYSPYFLAVHQGIVVDDNRAKQGASSNLLLDQVNAWLNEISPGVSVAASEIGGADLAQLIYRYGGTAGIDSSNPYRATNVGFGLTYVLPVIIACLASQPDDLVLLENPEAHLHPRGQTAMGELLCRTASSGVQVVAESHSDHLLNGIRLSIAKSIFPAGAAQIHFFKRRADGRGSEMLSPSIDSSGRIDVWPDGFFDEWERSLMELV